MSETNQHTHMHTKMLLQNVKHTHTHKQQKPKTYSPKF